MLAPFIPFVTEMFYTNLKRVLPEGSSYKEDSVHFVNIPEFNPNLINEDLETSVDKMNRIIALSRALRLTAKNKLNNK